MGGLLEALSKKQAKPRGFRFKPMYFDADKAEFNARVERLRAERDARDIGGYLPHNFKGTFSKRIGRAGSRSTQMYNLRLLLILSAILLLSYLLFQTSLIDQLIKQFLDVFSKKNGLY